MQRKNYAEEEKLEVQLSVFTDILLVAPTDNQVMSPYTHAYDADTLNILNYAR